MSDTATSEMIRWQRVRGGLTVATENMPGTASVGLTWLTPMGSATEPEARSGRAAMLSEYLFRGAGGMTSREHSDALDRLGVQRSPHVSSHHLQISASLLGRRLEEALGLIAPMITAPVIPADAEEAVRSLCLQSLESLNDDPQHLSMLKLRELHLPAPMNRHGYGSEEGLQANTATSLRDDWKRWCGPEGSILAIAGMVNHDEIVEVLEPLLGTWTGEHREPAAEGSGVGGVHHVENASSQTHLGMALGAPTERDEACVLERLATRILGGGSSSRLFTEVREKRGLCYSVGASYQAGRDLGMVSIYAGSTPQRAQQTVDVIAEELVRMSGGVSVAEFARAKMGLKSRTVMQGESTSARAAALATDLFKLGRGRSLGELAMEVERVSLEQLNVYLAERDYGATTVVALGEGAVRYSM